MGAKILTSVEGLRWVTAVGQTGSPAMTSLGIDRTQLHVSGPVASRGNERGLAEQQVTDLWLADRVSAAPLGAKVYSRIGSIPRFIFFPSSLLK
jgi:hypothetical protein